MHRRTAIAAAILVGAVLAAPVASQAGPRIDSYHVRDAGDRIVHRISWCTGPVSRRFEYRARWRTFRQRGDGRDREVGWSRSWYDRGCWTTRLSSPDDLRFYGWYRGRVKLTFRGQTILTR